MNGDARVRSYARQHAFPEGTVFPDTFGKLTPAQQRRAGHKENHATGRGTKDHPRKPPGWHEHKTPPPCPACGSIRLTREVGHLVLLDEINGPVKHDHHTCQRQCIACYPRPKDQHKVAFRPYN